MKKAGELLYLNRNVYGAYCAHVQYNDGTFHTEQFMSYTKNGVIKELRKAGIVCSKRAIKREG